MKKYRSDFNAKRITKFIESESKRLKLDLQIPMDLSDMEKNLPILEDFYHYASERNNILARNTQEAMDTEAESIGVLVTGGFHTEGITEYFKNKRISFVVIAPQVDELSKDDTRYIDALKGKKTPFEEQLEQEDKIAKNKDSIVEEDKRL